MLLLLLPPDGQISHTQLDRRTPRRPCPSATIVRSTLHKKHRSRRRSKEKGSTCCYLFSWANGQLSNRPRHVCIVAVVLVLRCTYTQTDEGSRNAKTDPHEADARSSRDLPFFLLRLLFLLVLLFASYLRADLYRYVREKVNSKKSGNEKNIVPGAFFGVPCRGARCCCCYSSIHRQRVSDIGAPAVNPIQERTSKWASDDD